MKQLVALLGLFLILGLFAYGFTTLDNNLQDSLRLNQASGQVVSVSNHSSRDVLVAQIATPTQVAAELMNTLAVEDQVLINLYQRVNPSVVNIEIAGRTSFFDGISSSGSGFVYDQEGHIITNAHVVADATEILVTFHDGYVTNAEIVAVDEYSDLAVLRVNVRAERLFPAVFGDSSQLLVGQRVVAIGNPFGLQSSMTRGIISAVGRALPSARLINQSNQRFNNPSIIQVDAAVNPGNSGGPLLNYAGEVVGVNTAIRTDTGTFQGVAFAVPSNTLVRVVPQMIDTGTAEYSWLGVSTFPQEPGLNIATLAEVLELPTDYGVMIEEVTPGSPADEAGLQGGDHTETVRGVDLFVGGDIVIAVNGVAVRDLDQLLAYLVENTSPGDIVTLTVIRGEESLDFAVELGIRP
jgi:S1-C subfamily serine protease